MTDNTNTRRRGDDRLMRRRDAAIDLLTKQGADLDGRWALLSAVVWPSPEMEEAFDAYEDARADGLGMAA